MTIDLLPRHGVRLPAPLPELRFGLSEAAVRALLDPYGALLPGGVHRPSSAAPAGPWPSSSPG